MGRFAKLSLLHKQNIATLKRLVLCKQYYFDVLKYLFIKTASGEKTLYVFLDLSMYIVGLGFAVGRKQFSTGENVTLLTIISIRHTNN